jgi:hypothetical protein
VGRHGERSKVGDSDRRALYEEIVLDVLVDLEGAFPRALRELDDTTEATLRAELTRFAMLFVERETVR